MPEPRSCFAAGYEGRCVEMMKATKITQSYRKLHSEIEEILFRCDPIGISSKENKHKYDPEVETIIPRLKEAKSESDVHKIICEEVAPVGSALVPPETKPRADMKKRQRKFGPGGSGS